MDVEDLSVATIASPIAEVLFPCSHILGKKPAAHGAKGLAPTIKGAKKGQENVGIGMMGDSSESMTDGDDDDQRVEKEYGGGKTNGTTEAAAAPKVTTEAAAAPKVASP